MSLSPNETTDRREQTVSQAVTRAVLAPLVHRQGRERHGGGQHRRIAAPINTCTADRILRAANDEERPTEAKAAKEAHAHERRLAVNPNDRLIGTVDGANRYRTAPTSAANNPPIANGRATRRIIAGLAQPDAESIRPDRRIVWQVGRDGLDVDLVAQSFENAAVVRSASMRARIESTLIDDRWTRCRIG
jgi:hypothetical protein